MSWFRNASPQFSIRSETHLKPGTICSFFVIPSPSPSGGLEGRMGLKKGKSYGLRLQQFTGNSNEFRKLTVTAMTLMTVYKKRREWFTCDDCSPEIPWLFPPPWKFPDCSLFHSTWLRREGIQHLPVPWKLYKVA